GYHAIVMRLRQKGLTAELCERITKQFFAGLDEGELPAVILRVIERRRAHEKDKNRLFAWLKRRGFRSHEITQALQTRLEDNNI
ncbi:MAG: RecX family transcriptional regulator, partial [Pseudomonadota bacterium]|nr:RecX family transcriptional regulator [Pseudomonadota bacterium]